MSSGKQGPGGAGTGRSRPTRVAEALAAYLKRSGLGDRLEETSVLDDWADRVGPRIAAVSTPVHVANGALLVAVTSSAWLMELRIMEGSIRSRLNEGRDRGRVNQIRFVLSGNPVGEEDPEDRRQGRPPRNRGTGRGY
jgi:predicted nucleic acid-binding Zn ribbon protein